jgi:hypothetical protein
VPDFPRIRRKRPTSYTGRNTDFCPVLRKLRDRMVIVDRNASRGIEVIETTLVHVVD